MHGIEFYPHQIKALDETENLKRVAYYHSMGLGKTFTGAEKMHRMGNITNLVICQKSKIFDWIKHFEQYYDFEVYNLTKKDQLNDFYFSKNKKVGIINYDLVIRRPMLQQINNFTLMLDESSLIQNDKTKRCKFISKLNPSGIILLSGTPVSGKYERLWSQMQLLGWKISKNQFWERYVSYHLWEFNKCPVKIIDGYQNIEELKSYMHQYGCRFLKTEDVLQLPLQRFVTMDINSSPEYFKFRKDRVIEIDGLELVGDTVLTKMLHERELCGIYSQNKLEALKSLLESTEERVVIFYNFNREFLKIADLCESLDKKISVVNGQKKDLTNFIRENNSVALIQYQAGAMGLNLQKSHIVIYYTPPLSSDLFEQSKKRTHRIGQNDTCIYYYLICNYSIENKIYDALARHEEYTAKLFEKDEADI